MDRPALYRKCSIRKAVVLYVGKARNRPARTGGAITRVFGANSGKRNFARCHRNTASMNVSNHETETESALRLNRILISSSSRKFQRAAAQTKAFPYSGAGRTPRYPADQKAPRGQKKKAIYYGPLPAPVQSQTGTLNQLQRVCFWLADCFRTRMFESRSRPCLQQPDQTLFCPSAWVRFRTDEYRKNRAGRPRII